MASIDKSIKFNIGHNQDDYGLEEALISYRDIRDGYEYPVTDMWFSPVDFEDFINELTKIEPLNCYDFSKNKNITNKKYINNKMKIYANGNGTDVSCDIYTKSDELALIVWKAYQKYKDNNNNIDMYYHSFSMNGNNVHESSKVMQEKDLLEVSKMYYPYIDTDLMFEQFFEFNENILLLVGEPGIGKSKLVTTMLKYAFQNTDKLPYDKMENDLVLETQYINVGYVKDPEVLAQDAFWTKIGGQGYDFIILDDFDYMLTKREADVQSSEDITKNKFLSQILSFTDGVDKHKTKFIITTNQSYENIDKALLRKGRLFNILELRKLDKSEALAIWLDNNLNENDFHELFNTHDITPADLGSEISRRKNPKVERKTESYLKEPGISKLQQSTRNKKMRL